MSSRRHGLWPPILAALLVAGAALLGSSAASSGISTANLLQNPGFEAGLANWTASGQAASSTTWAHEGSYSASLTHASGIGGVSLRQRVDVVPEATYAASAWLFLATTGVKTASLQVFWLDASGATIGSSALCVRTASASWQSCSIQAVAPALAAKAEFVLSGYIQIPLAMLYLDDTSFRQTAAPPTVTWTPTHSPMPTRTSTPTHGVTPTRTSTPSRSVTPTHTATRIWTRTATVPQSGTATATVYRTATHSPTRTATPSLTPAPPGVIMINEVEYDPAQSGADGDYEWVELFNPSDAAVTLVGWSLSDNSATSTVPTVTIATRGFVVVAARVAAFRANYPAYSGVLIELPNGAIGNGLANTGDRLILKDGSGQVVDALSYGDDRSVFSPPCPTVAPGHSLERRPAGYRTGQGCDFQDQAEPSPGQGWATPTLTPTPSATPTITPTPSHTATPTDPACPTPTATATLEAGAPTATETATATATAAPTATPSISFVFLPLVVKEPTPTPTPTATPNPHWVTLNEILPAPRAIDWNGDGKVDSGDEWVELYNAGPRAVDVSGWALDDDADAGSPFWFLPAGTVIPSHGFLVLYSKETGINFANTRDVVRLLWRDGTLLEEYRYFDTWDDRSFSKTTDGGAKWTIWYAPSPGRPNAP